MVWWSLGVARDQPCLNFCVPVVLSLPNRSPKSCSGSTQPDNNLKNGLTREFSPSVSQSPTLNAQHDRFMLILNGGSWTCMLVCRTLKAASRTFGSVGCQMHWIFSSQCQFKSQFYSNSLALQMFELFPGTWFLPGGSYNFNECESCD